VASRLSPSPATPGNDCREYRNEKGPASVITIPRPSVSKVVEISPMAKRQSHFFREESVTNRASRTLKPIRFVVRPEDAPCGELHVRRFLSDNRSNTSQRPASPLGIALPVPFAECPVPKPSCDWFPSRRDVDHRQWSIRKATDGSAGDFSKSRQ